MAWELFIGHHWNFVLVIIFLWVWTTKVLSVIATSDTLRIPNMTRDLLFPRGRALLAGLRRNYGVGSDKALFEWHRAGGSVAGPVSMYRCQGLPQGWDSKGSDSKASSTWAHAHGRSVYKHYPGIPQRERQVRSYVTTPKANSISSRLSPGPLFLLRLDNLLECCRRLRY